MSDLLPWHQEAWNRLAASADSLHHGLILNGLSGIGKREFSVALAQRLLCARRENLNPCGDCQNCKLFVAGTHPDLHVITSEYEATEGRIDLISRYSDRYQDVVARGKKANPSQVIPVDQIRTLIERFYQSSHISDSRIALIVPADRMNANAANALLKLLEEPPAGAFFLLVTDQPGILPATIRSRCVNESLPTPSSDQAEKWILTQISDADLTQLPVNVSAGPIDFVADQQSGLFQQQLENLKRIDSLLNGQSDPLDLASQMVKQDAVPLLNWMHKLVFDMIKWQGAGQVPMWADQSSLKIDRVSATMLYKLYDKLGSYRRMARDQLNVQLALEEILISFQNAIRANG
ncbi:MAG: DNA polymerase III subunit delta' C-terminal domain-containing protein [bacterium]